MARRGRPPYPDVLTPREFEVLALLREGLSNDEIAERLGVSLAGAKYHVSEILGKLGVATREEAAAWQSAERPWWAAAFSPIAWSRRLGWPQGAALVAAIAVAAGIGLLIWGLVRTSGSDDRLVAAQTSTPGVAATPTSTPNLPPLPTRTPFVGSPIDCPGAYGTPELAIEACVERRFTAVTYAGDCNTPAFATPAFDRPCSIWEDGPVDPRSYKVINIGGDGYDRYVLERGGGGWTVRLRAGCSNQNEVSADSLLDLHGADLSEVRIDDCRYPPPPLVRPTERIGAFRGFFVTNGRTTLSAQATFSPQRGVRLLLGAQNISDTTLPWTSDVGADITLTANDGTVFTVSEVGGTLARDVPDGIAPGAGYTGWLVFPIETFGSYTLRYPGQPDVLLDLTPEAYRASRQEYFDNLKR